MSSGTNSTKLAIPLSAALCTHCGRPNDSLDRRVAGVKRDGVQSICRWEKSRAGTRTTAELLWELRNDPKGMAMAWIGAALFDKRNRVPDSWRGETYRLVDTMYRTVLSGLTNRGFREWHHASRDALPVSITDIWGLEEAIRASNVEQVLAVIAVDTVIARTTWTVVRLFAGTGD